MRTDGLCGLGKTKLFFETALSMNIDHQFHVRTDGLCGLGKTKLYFCRRHCRVASFLSHVPHEILKIQPKAVLWCFQCPFCVRFSLLSALMFVRSDNIREGCLE